MNPTVVPDIPLGEHLRRSRTSDENHLALVAGEKRWTYGQLDDATDRIAAALAKLGIRKGDRVALQLGNCPEMVMAYYACFKLGAVAVPINSRFAAPELEYTLNHSGSRICISQPELYAAVEGIRSALKTVERFILVGPPLGVPNTSSFDDLLDETARVAFPAIPSETVAAILYTSGTTSRPKGVIHTHGSLTATAFFHGGQVRLASDDVICVIPPMGHIFGFATQMVAGIFHGSRLVLVARFDPALVFRAIEEHRGTRIAALPTMYQALLNHPGAENYSLSTVRMCLGGGDAVPVALQERFLSTFGVPIQEGCGMTEVIPFTLNTPDQFRIGSIGKACPGMTIRLVDDAGLDVVPGETGEILVRSASAMTGYWLEPEISAATMAGGFVHTGDLARQDADGFYWFTGRKKEIIIRGGSNISPLEVEEVLYQHPAIRECGVVGVPDAAFGEVVWAYVSLRDGQSATAAEIQEFAKTRIAPYKVPEEVHFLDLLPKGPTGKVHRRTLRERATSHKKA